MFVSSSLMVGFLKAGGSCQKAHDGCQDAFGGCQYAHCYLSGVSWWIVKIVVVVSAHGCCCSGFCSGCQEACGEL